MSTGDITIRTNPPGATVYVDSLLVTDVSGNPVVTPVKLTLVEGMYMFQMTLPGYYENFDREYIYCGSDLLLERNLEPHPAPYGSEIPYGTPV